jgi:hypothetical protein
MLEQSWRALIARTCLVRLVLAQLRIGRLLVCGGAEQRLPTCSTTEPARCLCCIPLLILLVAACFAFVQAARNDSVECVKLLHLRKVRAETGAASHRET